MPLDTCLSLCTLRYSIFRSALLSCAQHLSLFQSLARAHSLINIVSRSQFDNDSIQPIKSEINDLFFPFKSKEDLWWNQNTSEDTKHLHNYTRPLWKLSIG